MAKSSEHVVEFLDDLVHHAKPVAEKELAQLKEFATSLGVNDDLHDEQIKPYFPAPTVFAGLFEIVNRLFGIRLVENSCIETWHEDVQCFDVFNSDDVLIGQLYADLYVRKQKRGGAWMGSCLHRRKKDGQVQTPVAFLTCNFSPPIGGDPALLKHSEVETLFHEFGHTLHHLLTQVSEMSVSGINGVEWDAVELPSQFLENWCWHEQSLQLIAKHYQTQEPLPADLLSKMRAAKNFQSGMQTLRQVEFALFDMRLHSVNKITDSVQHVLEQVRQAV